MVALMLAVVIMTSCGDDTVAPIPTPPAAKIDTFSGVLTLNGAIVHPFETSTIGSINATLTSLSPDGTKPIGLSLGTWNGSICQIVLDNPSATQWSIVPGQTSSSGSFCLRFYDAAGTVTDPQTYIVDVEHP